MEQYIRKIIRNAFPDLWDTEQVIVWPVPGTTTVGVVVQGSLHVHGSTHYYNSSEAPERIEDRLIRNLSGWKVGE